MIGCIVPDSSALGACRAKAAHPTTRPLTGVGGRAVKDQRPCQEFRSWREFVQDSLTRRVLVADRIDPQAFATFLCAAAERHVAGRRREDRRPGFDVHAVMAGRR